MVSGIFWAQEITQNEKCGTYMSEEYIQLINSKHSFASNPRIFQNSKSKSYSEYRPHVFLVSERSKGELKFSYNFGEDVTLENTDIYTFKKYNNDVYIVDSYGMHYYKIKEYDPSDYSCFGKELPFVNKLFKNYFRDLGISNLFTFWDMELKNPIGYESAYQTVNKGKQNYIPEFIYGNLNFEYQSNKFLVYSTKLFGKYEYVFDKEIMTIYCEIPLFDRCESIVLRNDDLVSPADLEKLTKAQLRCLRNTIFAKYGHKFASQDLIDYFQEKYWYNPSTSNAESKFTIFDKRNVEIIQKVEASK